MAKSKTRATNKGTKANKARPRQADASRQTLGDQLRQAIDDSGLSIYAVAKGSGLSQAVVQRFVTNERDLYLSSADTLAKFFGMKLTKPRLP